MCKFHQKVKKKKKLEEIFHIRSLFKSFVIKGRKQCKKVNLNLVNHLTFLVVSLVSQVHGRLTEKEDLVAWIKHERQWKAVENAAALSLMAK